MSAETSVASGRIEKVQRDLEEAREILRGFYGPWDVDETRLLWILKYALDAQQRALSTLLLLVEAKQP